MSNLLGVVRHFRYGAALVAVIISHMIGFTWYHESVFGTTWLRENLAYKKSEVDKSKMVRNMLVFTFAELANNLIFQFLVGVNMLVPNHMNLMRLALGIELMSFLERAYNSLFANHSVAGLFIDGGFNFIVAIAHDSLVEDIYVLNNWKLLKADIFNT